MQLKDVREHATFYTGQLSTSIRALALGGVAFVWVLSKDEHDRVTTICLPLRWATGCLVLALILDLLQYFVAGWVWRTIAFCREKNFYVKRDAAEAASRVEEKTKLDAEHAAALAARAVARGEREAQQRRSAILAILHSDVPAPIPAPTSLMDEAPAAAERAEEARIEAAVAARARFDAEVERELAAKITESRLHRAPAVLGYYSKVLAGAVGYAILLHYGWKRFF